MTQAAQTPHLVRFESFEVDLLTGELRRNGQRIKLPEQSFQILVMLLEKPGDVAMRQEIQNRLWPNDAVVEFENSINAAVKNLRVALEDSADQPRYIETLPRRGYRFIATVTKAEEREGHFEVVRTARSSDASSSGVSALHLARGKRSLAVIVAVLLLTGAYGVFHRTRVGDFDVSQALLVWKLAGRSPTAETIRSLAVLPLENLSGDAAQDYFADAMTDELITVLGQMGSIRVISRTSVMSYKGARKPLPQIARELDVDAVVEGTVLRSGEHVRITAQLIQARSDQHRISSQTKTTPPSIL